MFLEKYKMRKILWIKYFDNIMYQILKKMYKNDWIKFYLNFKSCGLNSNKYSCFLICSFQKFGKNALKIITWIFKNDFKRMIECIIYLLIPRLLCWFIECSMAILVISRVIFILIDFLAYMTNWFVDWIINWFIDWLNLLEINFQIFWLIDCLI